MNKKELNQILEEHKQWLYEDGGKCADLSYTDLSYADLRNADLSYADLRNADLRYADLSNADLRNADLSNADLRNADLRYADLSKADLRHADLSYTDLSYADLRNADLSYADLRNADLRYADLSNADLRHADLSNADLSYADLRNADGIYNLCPEEGSFIAYKKAQNYIVKLNIPEDAKRSSATGRKCRCNKAVVLSIEYQDGSAAGAQFVNSNYDSDFVYKIGETVQVDNFDDNRWNECAPGIHFFMTRQEAVDY